MTGPEFLNAIAAYVAWEAGKENGVNGALAALFVIRNRLAETSDLGQALSSLSELKIEDVRRADFQQFLSLVEGALSNEIQDRLTAGATDWGPVNPGGKERVAQVGSMLLWK